MSEVDLCRHMGKKCSLSTTISKYKGSENYYVTSLRLDYDLINGLAFKTTYSFEGGIIVVQEVKGSYRSHSPVKSAENAKFHSHYDVGFVNSFFSRLRNKSVHFVV